jgi:Domain of unknown function (DUF2828)
MSFKAAVANTEVYGVTANGAATLATSLDPVVDLFFAIGSSRGKDLTAPFAAAYGASREHALRVLAWARDIRGGAGERDTFRKLLQYLEANRPLDAEMLIPFVPVYGRWDDLFSFKTDRLRHASFALIDRALKNQDGLCAKWMPRKNKPAVFKDSVQLRDADKSQEQLMKFMGLSQKQYRKLLVGLTNVVETKMCAKDWDSIEFGKLPSVAASRYQKAFGRNAAEAYTKYKDALEKGEAKVNAAAIFPHDVVKAMFAGDRVVAKAQWEALPNFLGDDCILPMVDRSGSMSCPVGGNPNLTCEDIAMSLGLYLADKQKGAFKDMWLSFADTPKINILNGDIISKLDQLRRGEVGYSTNVEGAFKEVLRVALKNKVPQAEMPKYILLLSDMEFNSATGGASVTLYNQFQADFAAAGYELPKIVFWNLNARSGNVPVRFDEAGTALVSGFSPAILKAILGAKAFSPKDIMLEAIMGERYNVFDVLATV